MLKKTLVLFASMIVLQSCGGGDTEETDNTIQPLSFQNNIAVITPSE